MSESDQFSDEQSKILAGMYNELDFLLYNLAGGGFADDPNGDEYYVNHLWTWRESLKLAFLYAGSLPFGLHNFEKYGPGGSHSNTRSYMRVHSRLVYIIPKNMDLAGVEPASESPSVKTSSITVSCLKFPKLTDI